LLDQIADGERLVCRHQRANQANEKLIHANKISPSRDESRCEPHAWKQNCVPPQAQPEPRRPHATCRIMFSLP
jgi:hypothetical protein